MVMECSQSSGFWHSGGWGEAIYIQLVISYFGFDWDCCAWGSLEQFGWCVGGPVFLWLVFLMSSWGV